jgi:hypothetical protein
MQSDRTFFLVMVSAATLSTPVTLLGQIVVDRSGDINELRDATGGAAFHQTDRDVEGLTAASYPEWNLKIAHWGERDRAGVLSQLHSVSDDGGLTYAVRRSNFTIGLGGVSRDPLLVTPDFPTDLLADTGTTMHVVQFSTVSLSMYREAVENLGATLHGYLPHCSYIVEMDAATRDAVTALPFVRWVGPYHPYYKLSAEIRAESSAFLASSTIEPFVVSLRLRDEESINGAVSAVTSLGGNVLTVAPASGLIVIDLPSDQLALLARDDVIGAIELWNEPNTAMDNVRKASGGLFVSDVGGLNGTGVRAEVMDNGDPQLAHVAFQSVSPLAHNSLGATAQHATAVYGNLFGDGTAAPFPFVMGMIPAAQGYYADFDVLTTSQASGPIDRMCHICQLMTDHPTNCWFPTAGCGSIAPYPYEAVFQTNSWFGSTTPFYTFEAIQMDDISFTLDFLLFQAQGNNGTQQSTGGSWA